jgi:hypothetical protein
MLDDADAHLVVASAATRDRLPEIPVLYAQLGSQLGLAEVPADTNFFELGMTSLMIVEARAGLAAEGLQLPLTAFFHHPTIRALASALAGKEEEITSAPAATPRSRRSGLAARRERIRGATVERKEDSS